MKKPLWLVPTLLLAGCRSQQVAFQFQPAPATTMAMAPAQIVTSAVPAAAALAEKPNIELVTAITLTRPVRLRLMAPAATRLVELTQATMSLPKPLAHRLGRRHPTEGAAEAGLGRVALFFIGVTLAVLAGLAALVNVIFSIGFFTALGYTAAGLVVLFLLYSLLSGGKKSKT